MSSVILVYLYVIAPLLYIQTFPIIASELVLLASTNEEFLGAGLALCAGIIQHQPLVSPYRDVVLVHHGEAQVCVVVVGHSPPQVSTVPGYNPALGSNKTPGLDIEFCKFSRLRIGHFKLSVHNCLLAQPSDFECWCSLEQTDERYFICLRG